MKIAIVKPSAFGDVVHTLPAFRALRVGRPDAEFDWVVEDSLAPLLGLAPGLGRVIVFRRRGVGAAASFAGLLARLAHGGYDAAVDFQGLLRSALLARAAGRIRRYGFARAREGSRFFYTDRVETEPGMHAVDRYLLLAQAAGGDPAATGPLLTIPADRARRAAALVPGVGRGRPFAVVQPVTRWVTKGWPLPSFRRLARMLRDEGIAVALVGAERDRDACTEVIGGEGGDAVSLAGRLDPAGLAALLASSSVFVGNDSGPAHLADALDVPAVALFGASDPGLTGLRGERSRNLVAEDVPCRPCLRRACSHAEPLACLDRIDPVTVFAAVREVLRGGVDHSIQTA